MRVKIKTLLSFFLWYFWFCHELVKMSISGKKHKMKTKKQNRKHILNQNISVFMAHGKDISNTVNVLCNSIPTVLPRTKCVYFFKIWGFGVSHRWTLGGCLPDVGSSLARLCPLPRCSPPVAGSPPWSAVELPTSSLCNKRQNENNYFHLKTTDTKAGSAMIDR